MKSWRRHGPAALALLCALFASSAALADLALRNQERSARLNRVVSGLLPPDGLLAVGVAGGFFAAYHGPADLRYPIGFRTAGLELEYGPWPWLNLRLDQPYRTWSGGRDDLPASGSGLADGGAGLLVSLPMPSRGLGLAFDARTTLPTGNEADGLGEGSPSPYAGLALSAALWTRAQMPELRLHLNFGRRFQSRDEGRGAVVVGRLESWPPLYPAVRAGGAASDNDATVFGAALEFRKSLVSLFVEYYGERYGDAVDISAREFPRHLAAGLRWGGEEGLALSWGYEVPLGLEDPATSFVAAYPDFVLHAGLSYSFAAGGSDSDRDGIPDRLDLCPGAAEDRDGHLDEDGCPDPDNDEDGIPDVEDLAPDYPEDYDGYLDHDGIPDLDNDGDGILDAADACPDVPEDMDGHQDADGCPEEFLDADGDGLPDEEDLCPGDAEDPDGFEDEDGCPEEDNDLDGIADALDQCPGVAEDYDGVADEDGCPE
ncbi:thrombospondin type 3 repeat-containing protein [bacterium]|nr:thrombospondin type 3 repeat-containing protein [bacterium]MBU1677178.1 thrombospondin type 3 repeat-containing protein [bacterium]